LGPRRRPSRKLRAAPGHARTCWKSQGQQPEHQLPVATPSSRWPAKSPLLVAPVARARRSSRGRHHRKQCSGRCLQPTEVRNGLPLLRSCWRTDRFHYHKSVADTEPLHDEQAQRRRGSLVFPATSVAPRPSPIVRRRRSRRKRAFSRATAAAWRALGHGRCTTETPDAELRTSESLFTPPIQPRRNDLM